MGLGFSQELLLHFKELPQVSARHGEFLHGHTVVVPLAWDGQYGLTVDSNQSYYNTC